MKYTKHPHENHYKHSYYVINTVIVNVDVIIISQITGRGRLRSLDGVEEVLKGWGHIVAK